jgi:hypothetical protein
MLGDSLERLLVNIPRIRLEYDALAGSPPLCVKLIDDIRQRGEPAVVVEAAFHPLVDESLMSDSSCFR